MGRTKNTYTLPGGFNVTGQEPIDARFVVDVYADLLKPATWTSEDLYNGLIVAAMDDSPANAGNPECDPTKAGIYRLIDRDHPTASGSWKKVSGDTTIIIEGGEGEEGGSTVINDYELLTNKPRLNGQELSGNVEISIPQKTSDIINDSGFLTADDIPESSQPEIEDLDEIREGASRGMTAVQPSDLESALDDVVREDSLSGMVTTDMIAGMVIKDVNDLVNYYTKSQTYTKEQIEALIGSVVSINLVVVSQLPATGDMNKIYLFGPVGEGDDAYYRQMLYFNDEWRQIGTTKINLSDYITKEQYQQDMAAHRQIFLMSETALENMSPNQMVEGAIYMGYETDEETGIEITIDGNTVSLSGGVTLNGNTVTVEGAALNGNTVHVEESQQQGQEIHFEGNIVSISGGVSITGNTVSVEGASIEGNTVSVEASHNSQPNAELEDNTILLSSGVTLNGNTVTVEGVSLSDNTITI